MGEQPDADDIDIEGTEEARRIFKEKMKAWREEGAPIIIPSNFRAVR